jgi:putative spermidine/putrescine transport system substrate-binding protein
VENKAAIALYQEASRGTISRRQVLRQASALGLSVPVIAGLIASYGSGTTVAQGTPEAGGDVCATPDRPWLAPEYDLGTGPIVRAGFGGSFSEQEFEAVWNPFKELTGVEVVEVPHNEGIHEQVIAQQEAGRVEFDIVEATAAQYQQFSDVWMPIDYSIFPQATLDAMDERWKQPNAIGYAEVPIVIAWSEEAFPGDDKPDTWAKFWDTETYPGGRSLQGFSAFKVIEAALLADGVAKDQLYPLDIDRAFAKLEQIKPHVPKWWTSGTEAQQLLTSGEVSVIGISNSRIENLMDQKLPFTYTLNEAIVHSDFIGVLKDAPHAKAAMAVLAFRFEPTIGARIGELWRQPIPSSTVWQCADPALRERWTTSPENLDKIIVTDPFYWASEATDGDGRSIEDVVNERFAEFISS